VLNDGKRHRGPTWTAQEDFVLRKWFSRRETTEGKGTHAPLNDRQWESVLLELNGRRTKSEVRRRIRVLNYELKISLMIDGLIPRENVQKYLRQALGENAPHVPRYRPRIKGRSYYAVHPEKRPQ